MFSAMSGLLFGAIGITSLAASAFAGSSSSACTGSISSLSNVTSAVACSTVNINSFTVPAGQTFSLQLVSGAVVNMLGDVSFGNQTWAGPLFEIKGTNITFNGNGHTFNGNGPFYWDGQGLNGGVTKPAPMLKLEISGTFSNVTVLNTPARAFSVDNTSPLTISNVIVNNTLGNFPNANSSGLPAGHNTDGFDVSASNLVIENNVVINQDDCLAINKGSNIIFQNNVCNGSHGISVGSISSNVVVSNVTISGNLVINNQQAFRIKTDASATNSTVTGITYIGNTATGAQQFGVIIDQSYPDTLGTPGTGVIISNVNFINAETTVSVDSGAEQVAINCGSGSCTGVWDWSSLSIAGGTPGQIVNFGGLEDFSQ